MEHIPKVSFMKKNRIELEFEIFSLKSLYRHNDRLTSELGKPHKIDFYNFIFITKGEGVHYIDFQPYQYKAGSTLLVSKGQVHSFDVNADADGFIILFTEEFLSKNMIHSDIISFYRLYNYHLHSPVIEPDDDSSRFAATISEMYEEYYFDDDFAKEDILRALLKLLLLKIERKKRTQIDPDNKSERLQQFGRFKELLEKRHRETRSASEYAGMMKISYKHLNQICKSATGNTAKEVIDNNLILEVKRRLSLFDISVKELSYWFGFDEPTNFIKFFKKHTSYTPAQFRDLVMK